MTRITVTQHESDPTRGWTAYVEGRDTDGPDNLTGWGPTPAEAAADLLEQLEDAQ